MIPCVVIFSFLKYILVFLEVILNQEAKLSYLEDSLHLKLKLSWHSWKLQKCWKCAHIIGTCWDFFFVVFWFLGCVLWHTLTWRLNKIEKKNVKWLPEGNWMECWICLVIYIIPEYFIFSLVDYLSHKFCLGWFIHENCFLFLILWGLFILGKKRKFAYGIYGDLFPVKVVILSQIKSFTFYLYIFLKKN